jgi:hypothetical protein
MTREEAKLKFEILHPRPGEVLIVRTPSKLPPEARRNLREDVRSILAEMGLDTSRIAVVVLDSQLDLAQADPEELAAAGWTRKAGFREFF